MVFPHWAAASGWADLSDEDPQKIDFRSFGQIPLGRGLHFGQIKKTCKSILSRHSWSKWRSNGRGAPPKVVIGRRRDIG